MGPIHLHTKTIIQSTNTKSLRREDVNVIRHKHKGYCTSLCSFSGDGHLFQNDITTIFFQKRSTLNENISLYYTKIHAGNELNQLKC